MMRLSAMMAIIVIGATNARVEPDVQPDVIATQGGEISADGRRMLLDGWNDARATWYGGPSGPGPDGMDITKGSCGYGADIGNHFITAINTDGGYDWGLTEQCGQCLEVMCVDGNTRGTSSARLGPWKACKNAGVNSVVVKITDSCPCHHPNSSNQRWCCGDATHLDLSYAAFDAIAVRNRGVVDLKYRYVDCSRQGETASYDYDHSLGLSHMADQNVLDEAASHGIIVKAMEGPAQEDSP